MQLGQAQVVRSDWHDRTPSPILLQVNGGFAPHADTVRFTYTVPANRKAFIESFISSLFVNVLQTTHQNTNSFVRADIAGAGFIMLAKHHLYSGAVYQGNDMTAKIGLLLNAGDIIEGQTGDNSAGGNVSHIFSVNGVEFDA